MNATIKTEEMDLCWECTGGGRMAGNEACKVCRGTGYLKPAFILKTHFVQINSRPSVPIKGLRNP